MEKDNKKILTVSFVVAAILTAFVFNVVLETLSVSFGVVARAMASDLIRHGIPVGAGVICFAILQFRPKITQWADEVVVEIRKVVWPSRKDTSAMTVVVCIMLIISGVVLGIFDFVSGYVVNLMIQVN